MPRVHHRKSDNVFLLMPCTAGVSAALNLGGFGISCSVSAAGISVSWVQTMGQILRFKAQREVPFLI